MREQEQLLNKKRHPATEKNDAINDIKQRRLINKKYKEDSHSSSDEADLYSEHSDLSKDFVLSSDDEVKDTGKQISKVEVEKITLKREFFETFLGFPLFAQAVVGAYVKVNVMQDSRSQQINYFLTRVKEVQEKPGKLYTVGGRKTDKYLLLEHVDSVKLMTINNVSNSPLTDFEFSKWVGRMEKNNRDLPTIEDVRVQAKKISDLVKSKENPEEMKKQIEAKKEEKIKNFDRSLDITYELSLAREEYMAAKEKVESGDFSFKGK